MEQKRMSGSPATFNGTGTLILHTFQNSANVSSALKETKDISPYFQPLNTKLLTQADFETFEPRIEYEMAAADLTASQGSSIEMPRDFQTQFERDLHLMLDDLDLPNQSLTVSQMSSVQLQGMSKRSEISNHKSQSGIMQTMSSVATSGLQSARHSNLTISNSMPSVGNTSEKRLLNHEDSPDFNRREDLVSVTDDLTVSHTDTTDYDAGGKSQRGTIGAPQSFDPVLRNQNRTFADSVLDHQIGFTQNHKTKTENKRAGHARLKSNAGQSPNQGQSSREYKIGTMSRNFQQDELASSGLTDFDLLTRTQISNNLMVIDPSARSRIFIPSDDSHLSQSQITADQPLTKRTNGTNNNIFRRMLDDASSLNFTPDQLESDSHSQSIEQLQMNSNSQQNSYNHSRANSLNKPHHRHSVSAQNDHEQLSSARDSSSKGNPIGLLKQKIMQQNQQMRHKQKGDLELEQALETPPVAKQYTSSLHHQRQINELTAQNTELLAQVNQLTSKLESVSKEQLQRPGGGSELLKARALEAARSEIRELREQCQEQEETIQKMSDGHRLFERERAQLQEQIRSLEVVLEKQKIIMQGQKREMDAQVKALTSKANDAANDSDQIKGQYELKLQQMQDRCKTLEQRYKQCEELIRLRDVEIQELSRDLKQKSNQSTQLETQCYALSQEVKNYKIRSAELEASLEQREPRQISVQGFDNELRRLNDAHQQQLQKLKEENHQLKTKVRDFETKVKVSDMREQSTLLPQLAALLNVPQSLLLDTVNQIQDSKRIVEDELRIAQELTVQKELLCQQQEQQILQFRQEAQLAREAAQRAQQAVAQQDSGPSLFTKNLIYQKDIELQNQRDKISQLQEQNWQLEQEAKVKQMQIQNLNQVEAEKDRQITNLREIKQRQDQNVTELKDKLRLVLQKQDERLQYSSAKSSVAESVDRQRYEELVTMVLSLDLASDPLDGIVRTLQESFIDEFEQAQMHLQEQQKLVKSRMASLQQANNRLTAANDSANEQASKYQKEASKLMSKMNELQVENQNLEEFSKRQGQVVQQLEGQVLHGNLTKEKFLLVLEQVIAKDYSSQDQELVGQLRSKVENVGFGLSQIPVSKKDFSPERSQDMQSALLLEELSNHMVESSCQTTEPMQESHLARLLQQQQQTLQLREKQLIEATSIIEELQETQSDRGSKIEMLKHQVMTELQLKSDELEVKKEHVEAQRLEIEKRRDQLEAEFSEKVAVLEQQYQQRLGKSETSKQESIQMRQELSQMKKQLEIKQGEIEQLLEKSVQTPRQTDPQLKAEIKRWKEEIERLKKSYSDKEASIRQEFEKQKSAIEQLMQDQISEVQQNCKNEKKQAIDKAVDKVKVELLNKITELKNEQAKKEAEWQRQLNKFNLAKEEAVELALQGQEQQRLEDIKEAKLHVQQIWKRKLEDRQKQTDEQLREKEVEISELSAKLGKQASKHQQDINKMRQNLLEEFEERRALDMPRQVEAEVQVSQNQLKIVQAEYTSPMSSRVLQASPNQTSSCMCSEMHTEAKQRQEQYIEQLKVNFELELERQDRGHKQEIGALKGKAFKVFETIVRLECDKILETISFKVESRSIETLNTKRQEINDLIKDLVGKNDGPDRQLKRSFEALKLKITTVLDQLKQQIQAKNNAAKSVEVAKSIEVKEPKSEHPSQRMQSARQSTSSEVNLTLNQSVTKSIPEVRPNSDIKQYSELIDDQSEDDILIRRLQPQTVNSKGAIVVEVDKVVRDLSLLYETVRMSKFFSVLGCQPPAIPNKSQDFDRIKVVEKYRELLNDFFKMIGKLNQAASSIGEQSEAFKLRLANIDLKQQLQNLQQEQTQQLTRQIIQQVINKYQTTNFPKQVQQKIGYLEQLHFQISKDQFKLNQIADLFIKNGSVNQDAGEVLQKCQQFNECEEFLESSWKNKYLTPEMLSPDETAQLIANVITKLPGQNLSQSSEEVMTKALRICHESQISMPPLQRPPKAQLKMNTARGNNMPTPQINTLNTENTYQRSRSTGMQPGLAAYNMPQQVNGGSIYQTLEPSQIQNLLPSESTSGIVVSKKSVANDRYYSGQGYKQTHATLSSNTDFLVEDNDESILINNKSHLDEELQTAQTNVNHLFKKLKSTRFNTLQH